MNGRRWRSEACAEGEGERRGGPRKMASPRRLWPGLGPLWKRLRAELRESRMPRGRCSNGATSWRGGRESGGRGWRMSPGRVAFAKRFAGDRSGPLTLL
ncbi:unnamed protein product [Lampetra planeri]